MLIVGLAYQDILKTKRSSKQEREAPFLLFLSLVALNDPTQLSGNLPK